MHHRNRQRNRFIGRIPFIFLILGAIIFFGFYQGYFPNIRWTFSTTLIIFVVIAVVFGGLGSRRRERQNKKVNSEVRTASPYRQYEPPAVKKEEKDFTSTPKYQYRNHYEQQFCNYCGIKLETEEQSFCVNCGQKIN